MMPCFDSGSSGVPVKAAARALRRPLLWKRRFVMMTAVVLVLLTLCVCFGIRSYAKKLRQGGGCCGEREPAEKKVRVADRNRSHYPYHAVLKIDGMVCANCARRVENAINRMDGYWAEADVAGARANVHCKEKPDLGQLKEPVRAGGYTVLSAECAEDARHAG